MIRATSNRQGEAEGVPEGERSAFPLGLTGAGSAGPVRNNERGRRPPDQISTGNLWLAVENL